MTFASATPAQRRKVRDEAVKVNFAAQPFAQNAVTPTAAEGTAIDTILSGLATALSDVGATGLLPTQVVVANGATVNVENSAGALDSPATAVVAGGVLTGVNLAATKTILTNATKFSGVTITGTGTFFTPTIVNGVLTGGVLSAS